MSALTDLFSAMATKIRSKTGTATTYTPPEMVSDGIDDVYEAGVASVPVTSITPSNATPASISSGTNYNPTANGYAISSYKTKTPSNSSPVSLTSGDIYKMGGNGYAIYSYTPKTPSDASPPSVSAAQFYKTSKSGYLIQSYSDITPSDSTPVEITSGNIYKAGGAGYAIASSPTALAPSDSTPATITSGTIYKASGSGKAVASVTDITPSNSTPASMSSGTIYKAGSAGYAIASSPTTLTPSNSSPASIASGTIYKASAAGKAVASVTSVAPSNTSPASLTSGTVYKPSANGYAITSYTSVTPSSTSTAVASGDIVKIGGSGVIVNALPTLSGDAAVGNVLSGKTFYNNSYTKQTGTMTNNEAVSKTLSASERSYTVPAGYHNGSGSVTVPAVTATKRVGSTSTSVDVASDDWTVTLNCGDRLYLSKGVIADGYSQGAVAAASLSSQTGVDSGKTAIDASHVFSGYQGWVNGNKISGTYTAPTITSITPNDSTPVALSTTGNYNPTTGGYAIKNAPTTLTPNDSDPPAIASGVIYKGGGAGFAVVTKPTKTVTTLWTNSSPTSTFGQQDITGLASGISNFDYIRITYRWGKSDATSQSATFAVDEIPSSTGRAGIGMRVGTATRFRPIYKSSNTSIYVYGAYATSSTSASSDYVIPTKIEGIKYNGIS